MKKLFSLALAVWMLAAFFIPVSAEEGEGNPSGESGGGTVCEHSYSGWTPDGEGHSRVCSLCSHKETSATHSWDSGTVITAATCTTAGETRYQCTLCGHSRTDPVATTGHSYTATKLDKTNHTLTCACTDTKTEAHTWGEGTVVTAASCIAEGKKTYTCSKCAETKDEVLPKVAHTYASWTKTATTHSGTCSVTGCGHQESGNHDVQSETVVKEATCKEVGQKTLTCKICGQVTVEIPKKTEHTYDSACDPDCNVCGATREAGHKYKTTLSSNSSSHWYECTVCKDKKDENAHVPGPAATEQKAQTCLNCGYVMTAKLNHVHQYRKDEWDSDESGHWHVCSGCDMELEYHKHSYSSNKCNAKCSVCGHENEQAHIYDGTWKSDQRYHWRVCTVCQKEEPLQEHIPGPEATEEKAQTCTVCDYIIVDVHKHLAEGDWISDDKGHWKLCECGEKTDIQEHHWDAGTENEDTTVTFTCDVCGASRTEGEPEEKGGFPWWILLIIMILALAGAVALLIFLLIPRKPQGKFAKK